MTYSLLIVIIEMFSRKNGI